ncbi:retrovirus-related pol polyprotein from transposon TNT 1-94 [Tanacetum coccineum]
MRPFGYPVTILNTIDHLGKFNGKADEGFFVGYSINSKAFRVFNNRTWIVEENLHVQFSENTPNIAVQKHVMMQSSPDAGFKPLGDDEKKVTEEPRKEGGASTNEVNAIGRKASIKLLYEPNMSALEDIVYSDDDEDVGA